MILDFENLLVTDFEQLLEKTKNHYNGHRIDFSSINQLRGEKTIMELSFQQTLKESIDNG
jgi:hypothetical protein